MTRPFSSVPPSDPFAARLPTERVELALADKKPLFSAADARAEAERCLYCVDAPCVRACPTEIDVPTFIRKIASGNVRGSAKTIFAQNILGESCGRVCPVEVLCEGSCVYVGWNKPPIQIGRLQRYATATATAIGAMPLFPRVSSQNGKRIALVGAGPASLACAAYLALEGHAPTIFEKRALPGGLNTTGIAPYKLHAHDAIEEVEWVRSLGVAIETGKGVGAGLRGKELLDTYDAVFLGIGLGDDGKLGLPGEDGDGIAFAVAWIERMKNARAAKAPAGRVIVVGGGNTAIDVARECAQLGATDVSMVYRRGAHEMSGYAHEMEGARKDGVRLVPNAIPVAYVRDVHGKLVALRVARGEHGKPVAGTERDLPCDLVVLAIGQSKLGALAAEFPGVEIDGHGRIFADATTGRTGNPRVFAGGDCVNGGKEVVNAVAEGRNAAREMIRGWAIERAR